MKLSVIFVAAMFAAAAFLPAYGQTPGSIDGTVTDEAGAVVSGAEVTLIGIGSGISVTVATDASGRFSFDTVRNGRYLLRVVSSGFSDASRELVVENGELSGIDFVLRVGNINESVTVTAERNQIAARDTPVTVTVVGRDELETKPVNTVGDIFRNTPGTSTVNEGSFQVRPRIRGLDSNRVLVLVDGERLNNGRTSTQQSGIEIGLVETDQIESIEIVRGSGSVLYGTDALAGTINIITRDLKRRRGSDFRFGAGFNSYFNSNDGGWRGSVSVDGSGDRFAFRLAQTLERYGNYHSGDPGGLTIEGVTNEGEVLNGQSHGGNTQATARFFFDDNNDLKIGFERRRASNIGVPTLVGFFNAFFPFSDRDKISGRYETRNLTESLNRLSASLYYQKQKRNFSNILTIPAVPPFFPGIKQVSETVTDTDTVGFDVQTNWTLGNDNLLIAGVSGFSDRNSDQRTIENFIPVRSVDSSKSVPDARMTNIAAFAQDSFRVNDRLQIVGGVRIERTSSGSEPTEGFSLPGALTQSQIEDLGIGGLDTGLDVSQTALTGDVGMVYRLTGGLSYTARVGRSFRVPNLFELFFTDLGSAEGFLVGNPALEPESGVNFDTSLRYSSSSLAGSFTYFSNHFRNFLSNEIARDRNGDTIVIQNGPSSVDVYQTVNLDRVRIQGFEAEAQVPLRLGFGFLTPGGSVSYLRGDNLSESSPLNSISPLKAVLNLRWENLKNNYYIDWSTRSVLKQERLAESFLDLNGGPEPGFTVSDMRGGYVFRRGEMRVSLNAGVTNLFGRFYNEQFVLAPARGRSFVFGTNWRFN